MERKTSEINNVRIDKASINGYDLSFTINVKNTGVESITAQGMQGIAYSFNINKNYQNKNTSINFNKELDMSILQIVLDEFELIKTEINPL